MSLVDLILLGIALGIDCLVVSFSQGLIFTQQRVKNSLKLALIMGAFQGLMPVIGYTGTDTLYNCIVQFCVWISFGIFFILGLKFIFEAFKTGKEEKPVCMDLSCLLGLGVATSIDALVSGASLRLTNSDLFLACIIIGILSFIMSLTGFWTGNKFKNFNSKYLEIAGGVILIILAVKAL